MMRKYNVFVYEAFNAQVIKLSEYKTGIVPLPGDHYPEGFLHETSANYIVDRRVIVNSNTINVFVVQVLKLYQLKDLDKMKRLLSFL